jgi:hypothetical protein
MWGMSRVRAFSQRARAKTRIAEQNRGKYFFEEAILCFESVALSSAPLRSAPAKNFDRYRLV